jgi:hypothetical protein
LETDPEKALRYYDAAVDLMLQLSRSPYLAKEVTTEVLLKQGSVSKGQYNQGQIYGDYYYLEALLRFAGYIEPF